MFSCFKLKGNKNLLRKSHKFILKNKSASYSIILKNKSASYSIIVYLTLKNKLMQCINLSGGWNQESILFFLILKCDNFSFGWDLIGNNASFAYNNQSTICRMAPHDCNCQPESFSFSRVSLGCCCFNLAGITAFK